MRTALICGKWELPVLPGTPTMVAGHARTYYTFVNGGRTDEIARNVQCIDTLMKYVPQGIKTIVEPFGGIGGFTTVLQNALSPEKHIIFELDPDCLAQLRNAFGHRPGVEIRNEDSREVFGTIPADLYVLDIPSPSTLKSHPTWKKQWKQVTEQSPSAIIWHDSASRYLHLHLDTYSRVANYPIKDHETYAEAMSQFMLQHYGYHVKVLAYSQNGHYFLAEPGKPEHDIIFHRITGGSGFQWKRQ